MILRFLIGGVVMIPRFLLGGCHDSVVLIRGSS